jgi:hypothetical protein
LYLYGSDWLAYIVVTAPEQKHIINPTQKGDKMVNREKLMLERR